MLHWPAAHVIGRSQIISEYIYFLIIVKICERLGYVQVISFFQSDKYEALSSTFKTCKISVVPENNKKRGAADKRSLWSNS